MSLLNHATAAIAGAASTAAAVAVVPPDTSIWAVTVAGIPLGVLGAALAGSSARTLRDGSADERKLPRRALETLVDGFIGGWVAMFLLSFSQTRNYFSGVEPAILGALAGLLTEYLRSHAPQWAEQAWSTALALFSRRRSPDVPPSQPGDAP